MTSESIVKLRLSVWRDFVPGATLALWSGEPRAQRVITGDSEIQQSSQKLTVFWPTVGVSTRATKVRSALYHASLDREKRLGTRLARVSPRCRFGAKSRQGRARHGIT